MSDDAGLTTDGGRSPPPPSSPEPASPLENADTLAEILLRLPPAPSSLPRASLVCKLWRRLVSDPAFLRRFRARHRCNPPLLGFLKEHLGDISFTPMLDPPDSIPSSRFSMSLYERFRIVSCRHDLVLIRYLNRPQFLVWDLVSGDQHHIAYTREFFDQFDNNGSGTSPILTASVLRASGDADGGGDSSHFKVVLVGTGNGKTQAIASVYSSETGEWGDFISTACPSMYPYPSTGILVGGSLCWRLYGGASSVGILEFDLESQCLAVTEIPQHMMSRYGEFRIKREEGGGLGILFLSSSRWLELWKRKTDGDAGWVLENSVELDKLLSLTPELKKESLGVVGYVEENHFLLVMAGLTIYMIQLDSMQLKKSFGSSTIYCGFPFSSVYTPGMGIGGRLDGAELEGEIFTTNPTFGGIVKNRLKNLFKFFEKF